MSVAMFFQGYSFLNFVFIYLFIIGCVRVLQVAQLPTRSAAAPLPFPARARPTRTEVVVQQVAYQCRHRQIWSSGSAVTFGK